MTIPFTAPVPLVGGNLAENAQTMPLGALDELIQIVQSQLSIVQANPPSTRTNEIAIASNVLQKLQSISAQRHATPVPPLGRVPTPDDILTQITAVLTKAAQ